MCQLASVNNVVPHDGLSVIWFEAGGAPPDQRVAAWAQHRAGFSVFAWSDRRVLAERPRGGVVRVAPASRGIGRLGGRTKRCFKRLLRFAYTHFLFSVCR